MTTNQNGPLGERYAANYLRKNGFTILAANFTSRFGEIDLIAQKGDILSFIEVKTRSKDSLISPAEAIDYKKQNRIIKAALHYISVYGYSMQPRFDVIEIVTANDNDFLVLDLRLIEHAFDLSKIKDVYI